MSTEPHTDAAPPAELEPLFAALGARADQIPVGTAEGARRHGQRRRYRLIASYVALMLVVAGTAVGTVMVVRRPTPPAQPQPQPTGTFIQLRPVGVLPMDIPFPVHVPPDNELDPETSVSIIDGVAYVRVGGSESTPLRVGALDLATGTPVFPTLDLGRWDSGPDFISHRDGLLVRGDPQDGPGERLTMLDPATGAVRWERVLHQDLITRDGVIVATESSDVVGLDWRTGDEQWRLSYPGARLLSFGYANTPTIPALAGDLWYHQDTRVVVGVGNSIDLIETRTGQRVGAVTLREGHHFGGLNEDTVFAGIGRELWGYPITGDGGPTLIYTAPEGQRAIAVPCGESLLCVVTDPVESGNAGVVVLDRETYRKRDGWQLSSVGSAVGDRFLTPDGMVFDLNGATIGQADAEPQLAGWVTPGSVLTIGLSGNDEFTATVGGKWTRDGTWFALGQFSFGQLPELPYAWLNACDIDTRYLVCPTRDGFHAWQFSTG